MSEGGDAKLQARWKSLRDLRRVLLVLSLLLFPFATYVRGHAVGRVVDILGVLPVGSLLFVVLPIGLSERSLRKRLVPVPDVRR